MKKTTIIPLLFVLYVTLTLAFGNEISYIGLGIQNTTSEVLYNGTFTVTSYIFYNSTCLTIPDFTITNTNVVISEGDFGVRFNYTSDNQTFYIRPSIGGDNMSCFQYTASAQTQLARNATFLQGYTPSSLPIAGHVTGTLGSSQVDQLVLNTITYSGLLGFGNLTVCGASEIMKMSGGVWSCQSDDDGSDTTYNSDEVYIYESDNVFYFNESRMNDTIDARDDVGANSTEDVIRAINNSEVTVKCERINFSGTIGSAGICDGDDAEGAGAFDLNVTADDSGDVTILDSEELIIAGGNDINTTASGNTITINSEVVDTDTDTDTHVQGDNVYLYNDSTTMYLNETVLNATCDARENDTTYTNSSFDLGSIPDSGNAVQDDIGADCGAGDFAKGVDNDGALDCATPTYTTDTDTKWITQDIYLYNDTTTMYLNETWLNNTIDARENNTLTEDQVEAFIFDSDNTANLGMNNYNITGIQCLIWNSGGMACSLD